MLRRGEDEGPDAALCFDDAGAFELGVHAGDGVGVDAELDGELTDGRELLTGLHAPGGNGGAQPALELRVNRCAVTRVDGYDAHERDNTNVLVQ